MAALEVLEEKKKEKEARITKYEKMLSETRAELAAIEREILEQTTLREFEAFQIAKKKLVETNQVQMPFTEFEKLMNREIERLALDEASKPKRGRKKKDAA